MTALGIISAPFERSTGFHFLRELVRRHILLEAPHYWPDTSASARPLACSRTWKRGSAEDYARIFGGSGRMGPIASKNCAVVAGQSSMLRSPSTPTPYPQSWARLAECLGGHNRASRISRKPGPTSSPVSFTMNSSRVWQTIAAGARPRTDALIPAFRA
jgi:hypothetical protein